MAVDAFPCEDTDRLVHPRKTFYPAKIPIAHYQLRHFINSPESDIIYYASGTTVYSLNAVTRERIQLANLSFEARCTAAGHGWVCIGGEEGGHFASIQVDGGHLKADVQSDTDVDDSLPVQFRRPASSRRPHTSSSTSQPRVERIGEEIVNSISIHKLTGDDGAVDVVAVLTNNDKTVRIYSLTQGLESTVLDLPFPINHATISPNGQFLVAVGDEQQAFFFERISKSARSLSPKNADSRIHSTPPEWSIISVIQLYVPPSSGITGYFTTAWSPSGKLCAVGSECGYITVFDIDLVTTADWGEDAIVQVIRSSRPDTNVGPGAVRTMCFSPQPWDLLIWSEDHGRICVADLRTGLRTKQPVELDPDAENVQQVDIVDVDGDLLGLELGPLAREQLMGRESSEDSVALRLYQRALDAVRTLEMENEPVAMDLAQDYIETSNERRRRLRQQNDDELRTGLSSNERQVLDALRTTRQRDEARERDQERDFRQRANQNLRALHAELDRLYSPRASGTASSETRSRGDGSSAADLPPIRRERSTSIGSASSGIPSLNTLRDFLDRERERERERSTPESDRGPLFQPRRQQSVVLLSNEGTSSSSSTTPPRPTASSTTTTLRPDPPSSSSDPWRTIEAVMSRSPQPISSRARGTPPHYTPQSQARSGSPSTIQPVPAQTSTSFTNLESRRLRQLTRARERLARTEYDSRRGISFMRQTGNPEWGLRTAGVAISKDGRKLYVGTEAGIFEMSLNLGNRQALPAVAFR